MSVAGAARGPAKREPDRAEYQEKLVVNAKLGLAVVAAGLLSTGCVPLVPGAAQVRFTSRAADVTGCRPVGNVRATAANDPIGVANDMRDQAVGLNANVVFRTSLVTGVAYRCGGTADR
jgi:hypothetical protein